MVAHLRNTSLFFDILSKMVRITKVIDLPVGGFVADVKSIYDELARRIESFESAYQGGLGDLEMHKRATKVFDIIDEETRNARRVANDALKKELFVRRVAFARRLKQVSNSCHAPMVDKLCAEFEKSYSTSL